LSQIWLKVAPNKTWVHAGWIPGARVARVGDPTRCAPGTSVVAVERSFARSLPQIGFVRGFGFFRFVGESTCLQPPACPV